MKVRITTQYGAFDAELPEGTAIHNLFSDKRGSEDVGSLVDFIVTDEGGQRIRVTMLKSLIRIVEEEIYEPLDV